MLQASHVAALHEIHSSSNPLAEAVSTQKVTPDLIFGTLASSILTLDFIKMQAGLKAALAKAKTADDKQKLSEGWKEGVLGFTTAFAAAGLPGVDESHLLGFSQELQADKKAFASIVTIANTAVGGKPTALIPGAKALAGFVAQVQKIDDALLGNIILPQNLCSQPLAQGTFTKHFGQTFSLQVHISVPCITGWHTVWGIPVWPIWGWCNNTYTIASLSYNVDLQIGYRVTCCGGVAWGFASANVCATLLGIQFCAGCTASLIGAAGIVHTPNGTNCTYGLGLKAELKCTFAGATVLDVIYPFGYTFQGPCPPLKLCI